MGADQYHRWDELAASALDWWAEAGVDTLADDAPRDWLATPARPAAGSAARAVTPAAAAIVAAGPQDYATFWDWRLGDDAPERAWGVPLLTPEGPRDADLLVVLDQPDAREMIGGVEGALFDRILRAIGRSRADVLVASLAMAHPPTGMVSQEMIEPLAAVIRPLLALTPARTILCIGHTTNRALLEADDAPASRSLRGINRDDRELQALAIAHPRFMLKHPQAKREAWRSLQSLLGGQA
jgi:uracil-DNA glycosylase